MFIDVVCVYICVMCDVCVWLLIVVCVVICVCALFCYWLMCVLLVVFGCVQCCCS